MLILIIGLAVVVGLACAFAGRRLAIRKGRDATIWTIAGLLTGPIGLVALSLAREIPKEAEVAPTPVPDPVPPVWGEEIRHATRRHDPTKAEQADEEYVRRVVAPR